MLGSCFLRTPPASPHLPPSRSHIHNIHTYTLHTYTLHALHALQTLHTYTLHTTQQYTLQTYTLHTTQQYTLQTLRHYTHTHYFSEPQRANSRQDNHGPSAHLFDFSAPQTSSSRISAPAVFPSPNSINSAPKTGYLSSKLMLGSPVE